LSDDRAAVVCSNSKCNDAEGDGDGDLGHLLLACVTEVWGWGGPAEPVGQAHRAVHLLAGLVHSPRSKRNSANEVLILRPMPLTFDLSRIPPLATLEEV
jgi:hypothetical protein